MSAGLDVEGSNRPVYIRSDGEVVGNFCGIEVKRFDAVFDSGLG